MSTALFTPVAGQQGCADGLGAALAGGVVSGTFGYADAETAYAMKQIVEQTRAAVLIGTDAQATARLEVDADIPLDIGTDATATARLEAAVADVPLALAVDAVAAPKVAATATVPVMMGASAVAAPKVSASATVPIRLTAASSVVTRVTAAVVAALRLGTSSSVMPRIRAAVSAVLRWLVRSRGTVGGYDRVRVRDTSAPVVTMQDQSEGRPW
jgi:hypothetical protein